MFPKRVQLHALILLFACSLCVASTGNDIQSTDNFDGRQNLIRVESRGNDIDGGQNFDGSLNLIEVLNTTEPYWVYYQTYSNSFEVSIGENHMDVETICIKNVLVGLSDDEYNYTQYDYSQSAESASNYTGKFIYINETAKKKPPEAMTVYQDGETDPDETMTLEYTDPESHKCNVYTIFTFKNKISDGGLMCEMHVKDSQVEHGPTASCLEFYESRCTGKRYEVYKKQCKNKGFDDVTFQEIK
uniref:Lipocalin n=1 Tax=Rhipicephalus zambeziensis TaxID=60191 RepID=A0A224YHH1_9ACAR